LDGRIVLDILEIQGLKTFDSVKCTPDGKDAQANDAKYTVPPKRVGNYGWSFEPLLSSDPKDERGNESDAKDQGGQRSRFFDLLGLLGDHTKDRQYRAVHMVIEAYLKQ